MKFSLFAASLGTLALAGCTSYTSAPEPILMPLADNATANPEIWPEAASPAALTDPATEAKIDALLAKMNVRQKVGQVVQADIGSITPEDFATYPLGSLLAGGNSGPYGDERAPASEWDRMVREFRAASMANGENGVAIPLIFGVDAVHGHNNIPGATVFPHNIGLGAANDVDLIERIGAVTAAEVAGSGIEWTFAPTLAVPQELRWGRAYEGYSSNPDIVAAYGDAMVRGLQGELVEGQVLASDKVASTAKHFLADGGTESGKDQGDAQISERELIDIHAAGYKPAIDAGALTVMASFSSWNGHKHHGNASLLTDVLRGRMGFTGFVVGDWNGHGQIPGCVNTDCPHALNAGLDMYMASDSWKGMFQSLLGHVESGAVSMERLDEAVRRILRVKYKVGLMDAAPTERTNVSVVGQAEHLAVAREAVAKSLVLLKNEGSVLPVKPGAKVLVTGPAADSMAMQSGGWTVSWQGDDVTSDDFPNGNTLWKGIEKAVADAGGSAVLSEDASFTETPDVAIVVFGEKPYAEFQGDVAHLDFADDTGLNQIESLKAAGIPVVAVFISGRPMFTGPEMTAADAFVAAWLPGSQGEGVADVLIAQEDGTTLRDFIGTLSFAWPAGCEPGAATLFPLGFGGSYASAPVVPELNTQCALSGAGGAGQFDLYDRGLKSGIAASAGGETFINLIGNAGGVTATGFDVAAQEDARRVAFAPGSKLTFTWEEGEIAEAGAVEMTFRVAEQPSGTVTFTAGGESVDLSSTMKLAAGKDFRTLQVPIACLGNGTFDSITLSSEATYTIEVTQLRFVPQAIDAGCTPPY